MQFIDQLDLKLGAKGLPYDIGKKVVQAAEIVGAGVVGVLAARKLLQILGSHNNNNNT